MVEHLPSKRISWVRVPPEQLFFKFSMEKELFRLVVLSCFDLCFYKRFHVNTQLGVAASLVVYLPWSTP